MEIAKTIAPIALAIIMFGLGLGLIFGSSTGFLITSSIGQVIEGILPEDPTTYLIPVFGSFWRVVLFGIFSQSLIALTTMILGVPKGLDVYEQEQADIVRKRITGSIVVPLGAITVSYTHLTLPTNREV